MANRALVAVQRVHDSNDCAEKAASRMGAHFADAEYPLRRRHAARLLLDQANVAEVSHQVHLALFYDAQLDIGAMGT
jgi:hypothetical protein